MEGAHLILLLLLSTHTLCSYCMQRYLTTLLSLYTLLLVLVIAHRKQNGDKDYVTFADDMQTKEQSQFPNHVKHCEICNRLKPPRYYHCRKCQICIYRMNHHCEWLGCCIGQYNGKIYLQILVLFVVLQIEYLVRWFEAQSLGTLSYQHYLGVHGLLTVYLLLSFIAVFGMYESGRMLLAYLISIEQNQTLVQTYKKVKGAAKDRLRKIQQICGRRERMFAWLLPVYPGLQCCNKYQQVTMQYGPTVKEYKYADQYLLGPDDDEQFQKLFGQGVPQSLKKLAIKKSE